MNACTAAVVRFLHLSVRCFVISWICDCSVISVLSPFHALRLAAGSIHRARLATPHATSLLQRDMVVGPTFAAASNVRSPCSAPLVPRDVGVISAPAAPATPLSLHGHVHLVYSATKATPVSQTLDGTSFALESGRYAAWRGKQDARFEGSSEVMVGRVTGMWCGMGRERHSSLLQYFFKPPKHRQ